MSDLAITPMMSQANLAAPPGKTEDPAKIRDAAQQFEALLIGQLLQSARAGGEGWLGGGGDSAGRCASDYAEQQFAAALAQSGGLGLASLVTAGLERDSKPEL
jgi:Rod binding domain-containing protein